MAMDNLSTSGALRFTEKELGGPCTETEAYITVGAITPVNLCQGNGDRVGLIFMNIGSNNCYVGLIGAPSSTTGLLLPAGGGVISMNVRDDFTLTSRQWSVLGAPGGTIIYVLEIIRFKNNDGDQG